MDNKILSLTIILILLIAMASVYVVINQSSDDEDDNLFGSSITDEDIKNEIDDSFLDEDDEIDIGEIL